MRIVLWRKIGGFLIILSFVLPLSTCQVASNTNVLNETREVITNYGYSYFDVNDMESWLFPIAFFWPVPVLLFRERIKKKIELRIISVVEVLLCCYSAYLISSVGYLGKPKYGLFVAIVGVGVYVSSVITEIVRSKYYDSYTP